MYQMIRYLDEPQRFLGLTLDEAFIGALGLILMISTTQKILAGLFCFGLYMLLNAFKKGGSPRSLLVSIYWFLPFEGSLFFIKHLPPSHYRVWRG